MDILVILLLILLNGVFAMSEIAIVSVRRARLQQLADEGDRGARAALELSESPTYFLSTVQFGVSLITILIGAFGESSLTDRLEPLFAGIPLLTPYAKGLATVAMVTLLTFVMLIFGELVPKRLGMMRPERVARLIAPPMNLLSTLAHPLVTFLSLSTEAVLRLLGARHQDESPVTEEEIKVLMAEGAEAGVFEHSERDIVANVFRLDDWRLSLIMTTLMDIEYIDVDQPVEQQRQTILHSGHSWLPVCRQGLNTVLGVLSLKDLLLQTLRGDDQDIVALVRPPLFAPVSMSPLALLELFKAKRQHLALVVDEYGDVQGLVTLKDLLDAVVGEIKDDKADHDPDIVRREDGSFLLDGALSIETFKDLFPLETEDLGEAGRDFQTLAGLVLFRLGHVPATGDVLEWSGLRIEVVDMDGQRIDKLLLSRSASPALK
jgi:putative hemolysin